MNHVSGAVSPLFSHPCMQTSLVRIFHDLCLSWLMGDVGGCLCPSVFLNDCVEWSRELTVFTDHHGINSWVHLFAHSLIHLFVILPLFLCWPSMTTWRKSVASWPRVPQLTCAHSQVDVLIQHLLGFWESLFTEVSMGFLSFWDSSSSTFYLLNIWLPRSKRVICRHSYHSCHK